MRILIDMNLSPDWVAALESHGISSRHWASIGPADAPDRELLAWAQDHDYVVFTHDLDFGELLAASDAPGPSVIQVRTQDVTPDSLAQYLIGILRQFQDDLERGALVSVDKKRGRARILPIHKS